MAGGGKGSHSKSSKQKSKKKGKTRGNDAARLSAAILHLSSWANKSRHPDPTPPRTDFHTHSNLSDGFLSPAEVVNRAHRNGVKVLALTDHDTMAGVPLALKAAQAHRIRLIPGVEISAKFGSSSQQLRGQEEPVHILAYYSCCGPAHCKEMEATLLQIREGRYIRAQAMVQKLESLNKPIKWDDVLEIAGKGVAPCRPHVAQALVAAGHVNSVEEAFSRYLNNSGPAYVAGAEQPAADVVRLIHRTGGMAVLAHPWTLKHPFPLIERLKDAGLDAIEVYKSDGKDAVSAEWATAYELVKLGGSDFHGRGTLDEIDIGGTSIPALAMLQFLTVAQPIWSSALRLIVQEFAESTSVHDMDHEYWKGDIFVREVEGRFCLVFSAWLTDEEKSVVQNEAKTLGLMHEVILEQGFECISVIKVPETLHYVADQF